MRRLLMAILIVTWLAPALHAQSDHPRELDEQLSAALEDIRERDAQLAREIDEALEVDPPRALRHLSSHARYLQELEADRTERPARYALLLRQEEIERTVRGLMNARGHAGGLPSVAERNELRAVLDQWFDLRQMLRTGEAERMERSIDEHEDQLARLEQDHPAARAAWIARITDGGRPAMMQRLEQLRAAEDHGAIAPAVIQLVMARDPEAGRALMRLAADDPERLGQQVEEIIRAQPELAEQARRRAVEGRPHDRDVRAAVLRAHEALLPLVPLEGETPGQLSRDAERALEALIGAEVAATEANLEQARRQIARQIDILAERAEQRAFIVELQLARLLGETERFDW